MLAVGLFLGAGCGGRTSALGEGYGPDDGTGADGSGAQTTGGASSTGARPSRGGTRGYGGAVGTAGTVAVGGAYAYGGTATAGAYGYGGVNAYGGGYVGGAYAFGGAYAYGGAYVGGGFPVGGYGGSGVTPGGSCCEAQMGPSCRPRAVAKCVCDAAPYCCDKQWDAGCASLVERLGCGVCERQDCDSCLNQYCGGELTQCYQDFGCVSIYSCMQVTGCAAFQCYSPELCGGVIDQWGGPAGGSMNMLLQAYACAVRSGCDCN